MKIELSIEDIWRIQLSLAESKQNAEKFLKEVGGDFPRARLNAKETIEECEDLLTKLEQI